MRKVLLSFQLSISRIKKHHQNDDVFSRLQVDPSQFYAAALGDTIHAFCLRVET
jgi:hypothetical protein